jgi:hypothetical protein
LNREKFKGTKYIQEALSKMSKKYPNDIEVIIDGQMPLDDYLNIIKNVDVVIDQCKNYSYGSMNSLHALSMGKVVMSGLRPECFDEYGLVNMPSGIIHIEPNVEKIIFQIEMLIKNKDKLLFMGMENREFCEKYHDCVKSYAKYSYIGFVCENCWNTFIKRIKTVYNPKL